MRVNRLLAGDEIMACALVNKFKSSQVSLNYMNKFLSNPRNYLIAAMHNEEVIGFILGYELERLDREQPMMFFYEIGVAEEYQRRGIGKALVMELRHFCQKNKFMKMYVITNRSNLPAMGLYQSTGAIPSSEDDIVFTYTSMD